MQFGNQKNDAVTDGVWFKAIVTDDDVTLVESDDDIPEGAETMRVLVAEGDNINYQSAMDVLRKPHRKDILKGKLSSRDSREMNLKAMAKTVFLDFNGKAFGDIKNTKENRYLLLKNNSILRNFVALCAAQAARFQAQAVEESAGK